MPYHSTARTMHTRRRRSRWDTSQYGWFWEARLGRYVSAAEPINLAGVLRRQTKPDRVGGKARLCLPNQQIVMVYIVMAYIVMAYIVMAYAAMPIASCLHIYGLYSYGRYLYRL